MASEDFDFLVGRAVEQIWVWQDTIRLVFEFGDRSEPEMYVDIPGASHLSFNGVEIVLDVLRQPDETGRVLALLNQRVIGVRAEEGALTVRFANGAELHSLPDDSYESWTVAGIGRVYQCLPGGSVDSW